MTNRPSQRSAGATRVTTPVLIGALLAATLTLGACASLRQFIWPKAEAPPCTPRHHSKLHPVTDKEQGFPYFAADTSRDVPTVNFQVCDSIAVDLNDDGYPEVIAADHIQPGFGYFVNEPKGTKYGMFRQGKHVKFLHGQPSAGIAAEDFNGDGIVDVVNSNHPGTVTVRLNKTRAQSRTFIFPGIEDAELNVKLHVTHGRAFGLADREGGVVAADFNLDGRPDIATANLSQTTDHHRGLSKDCPQGDPVAEHPNGARYNTAVLMNRTVEGTDDLQFSQVDYFPVKGPTISITSADFNGDGLPDLLTADPSLSSVSILTNRTRREPGAPACFEEAHRLEIPPDGLPQGAGPTNTVAADLNDDGKPDIASANWNTRTVTIWINTTPALKDGETGGVPRFSEPQRVETGGTPPLTLRTGDFDGDNMSDLVVFPLSTLSNAAMIVLRNESERRGKTANFVADAVYAIPSNVKDHRFQTYFTGAGFVEDFNQDGKQDIGVIVGRGSILLRAMKPGDNILEYIDPGVPLWTVHPTLPHKSGLLIYEQTDEPPPDAVVCREPEYDGEEFCAVANSVLGNLATDVYEAGQASAAKNHSDGKVRSVQAKRAARQFQRLVDTAPPGLRDDVENMQQHIGHAETRALEDPSWEAHDVEDSVERVTDYLIENCST